ncbi:methionyl-tRNA formyltransferase [Pedobacter riviphilus]|uniref:Methionyl-tRNA formyltransferase n=1 Tax=Pedobacter riviphilus TaxID=2766984 RepID=A0ABX6TC44_9SPHI|nr:MULTISPECIES: methionyl-tRNA formyltransferase [Pedobacter]NII83915.1 methionyl-tRNA formyltransferase [Pedobacter sp. SG908]NMN37789.1 methionyl-tRNA formyltransferase [Pedobacter sp. SG918]QNR83059.1 methionyl-tRNA formyltransferase [Pedobacter riviphilus]
MKIVFMGTPDFAVASLDALVQANFDVVAVVTAPDKPAGRGQKLNESAVKKYAVEKNIPVLQPEKLKNPEFLEILASYKADLQVVVAFRMLPEVVWNMPPKGTINLHGSLLPQYRGAAPINHAIINGEKESGVTTFFLTHEIDTGNIILSDSVAIADNETAGELHDKLMVVGANLLVKTLKAIEAGEVSEQPQPQSGDLKHAPKIFKDDCKIDWNNQTQTIYNLIRGLSPYPTAFTFLNDKILKIFKAEIEDKEPGIVAGGFLTDGKTYLKFAAKDGFIKLLDIQYEGKKRMLIEDFLRGMRL